ncbi:MAG: hypothetical protein JO112_19285 [Planctomycetes bacterium]|nr:hypothetical protein [Planctomycetota bacterium]
MVAATRATVDDFLTREYLSSLRQFPEGTRQLLLRGSSTTLVRVKDPSKNPPAAPVSDKLPEELAFLGGHLCDLGFDKLRLSPSERDQIYTAFAGEGVAVPGTPYKLRHSVMSSFTFVEPAIGQEVKLPADWRQTVRSDTWIGKQVCTATDNLSPYEDQGDGYILKKSQDG